MSTINTKYKTLSVQNEELVLENETLIKGKNTTAVDIQKEKNKCINDLRLEVKKLKSDSNVSKRFDNQALLGELTTHKDIIKSLQEDKIRK